jgi:cysteine-rich repeat protein
MTMLLPSLCDRFFRGWVGITKGLGGHALAVLVSGSLLGGCLTEAPLATGEASSELEACGCGNGKLEAGEGCDDGNRESGDGCNASCLIEDRQPCNDECPGAEGDASCASGVCDTTGGEPGTCEPANVCGNGKLEAGEGCDDGNEACGDGCDAHCLIEDGEACNTEAPGEMGSDSCASGYCAPSGTCGGRPDVTPPAPPAPAPSIPAPGTPAPEGPEIEDPDLSGLGISGGGCDAGSGGGSGATLLFLLALGTVWPRRRGLAPRRK